MLIEQLPNTIGYYSYKAKHDSCSQGISMCSYKTQPSLKVLLTISCLEFVPEERECVASMPDMPLLTVCDGLLLLSRSGEDEARGLFPSLVAHGRYCIWTSYLLHLL